MSEVCQGHRKEPPATSAWLAEKLMVCQGFLLDNCVGFLSIWKKYRTRLMNVPRKIVHEVWVVVICPSIALKGVLVAPRIEKR